MLLMLTTFERRARFMESASRGANFSVVIPFFNEEESAGWVIEEVRQLFPEAEVVAVDDGSSDDTWTTLAAVEGIQRRRLRENRGQSAALWIGLNAATRPVCVTMDGDGQNDPAGIADLVAALGENTAACGYRQNRRDTWSKKVASRVANAIRRLALADGVRDTGCSLKAFPRGAVEYLVPFDGMHRFMPAIFLQAGMKIVEVPVGHRERRFGESKYTNWGRGLRGLYDLFGMRWLLRRKIRFPNIEVRD
jgi:dolichol-phosphate mannosyltransferase